MSKIPFLWQKHLGNRRGLGHLLSYSNIGKNRQNTFLRFEDAGRNALTHGHRLDGGKLIVYQYLVEFSQLEFWFTTGHSAVVKLCMASYESADHLVNVIYSHSVCNIQFSNIWLRFGDREAKFILQPVHQVRPGLRSQIYSSVARATKAEDLLAMMTLKSMMMMLRDLDDDNINIEEKGFLLSRPVWSTTKWVIWLVGGVNGSIQPAAAAGAKNQFNFCRNLLHKELASCSLINSHPIIFNTSSHHHYTPAIVSSQHIKLLQIQIDR